MSGSRFLFDMSRVFLFCFSFSQLSRRSREDGSAIMTCYDCRWQVDKDAHFGPPTHEAVPTSRPHPHPHPHIPTPPPPLHPHAVRPCLWQLTLSQSRPDTVSMLLCFSCCAYWGGTIFARPINENYKAVLFRISQYLSLSLVVYVL